MRSFSSIAMVLILVMSGSILISIPQDNDSNGVTGLSNLKERDKIEIRSDSEFTSENGVSSGSGTESDPFIIENWMIGSPGLGITDTAAHFVIRNCDVKMINLVELSNGTVEQCNVQFTYHGVLLSEVEGVTVRGNSLSNNTGDGIILIRSNNVTIEGNFLNNNERGIAISDRSDNCRIRENLCLGNRRCGIVVESDSGNSLIESNICSDTYDFQNNCAGSGISVRQGHDNLIRDNLCADNGYADIFIDQSFGDRVLNNTLTMNRSEEESMAFGIYLVSSKDSVFEGNTLKGCGVSFWGWSGEHRTTNSMDTTNTVNGKPLIFEVRDSTPEVISGIVGEIILMNCSNKVIQDIEFESSSYGIIIGNSSEIEISDIVFHDMVNCIYLDYSANITVRDCVMTGFTESIFMQGLDFTSITGCRMSDGRVGIRIMGEGRGRNIHILSNEISIGYEGIYIDGGRDMNISDNSISGGTHGLSVVWAINSTASHNSIDSVTQWGLVFERGQRCSITDNLVMDSEVGLGLLFNYQGIVERNSLIWNKRGIVLDGDSNGNVIRLNNISSNTGYGIEIMKFNAPYYKVQNNSIYLNSLRENNGGEIQACVSNDGNFWDDRASKGNYWSDYEARYVPPATNDGSIWTVSYGVDGGDFDFFPLVKPPTSQEFIRMTRNHQYVAAANVNYSVQYKVFYSGDSEETLDWTFGSNASWLTFTTDHILKGKPSRSDLGSYWVDLSVTDGMISDHANFTLTIKTVNGRPKIISISNQTVDQWKEFKVEMEAIDDQTDLEWSMMELIRFLSIDRDTGVISGTPGFNDTGTFFVHIMVSDGDLFNTSYFFLTVVDTNDPPYLNGSWDSLTLVEDEKRICPLNEMVLDTEGDPLSFSVQGPKGITAIIDDGRLVLDPLEDWTGRLVVPLNVSDGTNSVSLPIKVNVIGVNDPPRDLHITTSTSIFDENGGQVVSANFTDPDLNDIYNVSWYVDGNLVGYGISLSLTLEAGRYNLTMRVTDGKDAFSETSLWITVRAQKDSKIDKKASHYLPVVGLIALILILFAIFVALLTIRKGRLKSRKEEGKLRKEEGSPNLVRRGFIDEGLSGTAVPWLNGDGSGMDDLKMEVLDSEIDLRHDTSRIAKRLKNRERNGDITESEFEEINSVLERIKEE